jgi:hypothetical protein
MWILVRLCLIIGAALLKFKGRLIPRKFDQSFDGVIFSHNVSYNKGKKTAESIEIPLTTRVAFKFTREGVWDRFFKAIGFSEELQTRDADFDQKIYISADHLGLFSLLRTNEEMRRLIKSLLGDRLLSIACDGNFLTFNIRTECNRDIVQADAVKLYRCMLEKLPELGRRFEDPFVWKAMIAQIFIWSVAGYALGGLIENIFVKHDNHFFPMDVVKLGMIVGLGISVVAFILLWMIFNSSSRGHRILVESFLVLIVSGPVASAQFVADMNRSLDKSLPRQIIREVAQCQQREHRNRRNRYYSYHLIFPYEKSRDELSGVELPLEMQVDLNQFKQAQLTHQIEIQYKTGFLGLPWYYAINGQDNSPL